MKRKNSFVMHAIADERLLVPVGAKVMDMNAIITLNSTSAFIWSLLDRDRSHDELLAAVIARFDVDHDQARTDIEKFLDEVSRLGLLQ